MSKIETFYFADGEDSGEAIFKAFASKHAHLFEDDCDALGSENKLEYTAVYNEFCQVFEQHIERKFLFNQPCLGIIDSCGVSVEQFFNALKEAQEASDEQDFYVQVLLSVTDY
jgi:hypothetical protein